jgi:hypothetical protein
LFCPFVCVYLSISISFFLSLSFFFSPSFLQYLRQLQYKIAAIETTFQSQKEEEKKRDLQPPFNNPL